MGSSPEPSPRRRLALAQCAPRLGDLEANLLLHQELAEQAADDGVNLCIFPELSLTGYLLKDLVPEVSMTLDDARLGPLLDLSRRLDLVVGMVLGSDDFRHYNAALYLSGGEVRHVHRKVYLPTYGMFDEARYFAAGDRVRGFTSDGLSAGILVCEDMWHLSTAYLLFVQGVSLIICPSAGPGRGVLADPGVERGLGSGESWGDLCRTVAQFSGCYVAYCNRTGYEDGVYFGGGSAVFGPDGSTVVAAEGVDGPHGDSLPQGHQLACAEIDTREVERQRQMTPLLRDENVDFTLRELERLWHERTDNPY